MIVSDIQEKGGHETVDLIDKNKGKAIFVGCDVSNENDTKNLVARALSEYGNLDCAFNNAGIEGKMADTVHCSLENWSRIINTNLTGVWLCMKSQIPAMLENGGGSIVNCSSIAGLVGYETLPAYVASKHGVVGLTKTAALEYAKSRIRVNAVCPGPIHTPMLERVSQGSEEEMIEDNPMKRVGNPEEIAGPVLWLCSKQASYVTGQAIAIDGGAVAK